MNTSISRSYSAADEDTREAGFPRGALPLFALTSGLAVASVYFVQPLMGVLATEFSLTPSLSGIIISFTQLGYVLGLLFLVPMADVVDRKRLIVTILVLSAVALVVIGGASSTSILIGALFLMGKSQSGSIWVPSPTCASQQSSHSGGLRAGAMCGGCDSSPMCSRMRRMSALCVMKAMMRICPAHRERTSGNTS